MNRPLNQQQIGPDNAFERLDAAFTQLDELRVAGLENATLLHRVQAEADERERERLAAKYGADHPRVQAVEARLTVNRQVAEVVAEEAKLAKIEVPDVDSHTWLVHGRVLRPTGAPVEGVTVSLTDESREWVRPAGHTCTDERGYFALRYLLPGEQGKTTRAKVHLTLTDDEGNTLLRDDLALIPTAGMIDSRNLVLPEDAGKCPPPQRQPREPKVPRDLWRVSGRVTDAAGNPAAGVIVSLYDKDLFFDDRLGQTTTDTDGRYELTYRTSDFRDLIERKPDLYVKILDQQGRQLHSTRANVRYEAGRNEVINVQLPAPRGGTER